MITIPGFCYFIFSYLSCPDIDDIMKKLITSKVSAENCKHFVVGAAKLGKL